MKKFKLLLLTLISVFVLISCSSAPITGRQQLKFVDDEKLASESSAAYSEFIAQVKQQNLLANSTNDGKRVTAVGNKLAVAVEKYLRENGQAQKVDYLNWEFNLIKSDDVNAFAMPGGKIAFYTGIMPIAKNDAGIAAIMGHEIGHVIAGHHAEGKSNETAAGIVMIGKQVADIVTGGATSVISNDLVGQGLSLGLLKFNRTQEYEADKYGMIFMAMAGYNPQEAEGFWTRMSNKSGGASVAEFQSTHPSDETRIKKIREALPEAMKYYKGSTGNSTKTQSSKTSDQWKF